MEGGFQDIFSSKKPKGLEPNHLNPKQAYQRLEKLVHEAVDYLQPKVDVPKDRIRMPNLVITSDRVGYMIGTHQIAIPDAAVELDPPNHYILGDTVMRWFVTIVNPSFYPSIERIAKQMKRVKNEDERIVLLNQLSNRRNMFELSVRYGALAYARTRGFFVPPAVETMDKFLNRPEVKERVSNPQQADWDDVGKSVYRFNAECWGQAMADWLYQDHGTDLLPSMARCGSLEEAQAALKAAKPHAYDPFETFFKTAIELRQKPGEGNGQAT